MGKAGPRKQPRTLAIASGSWRGKKYPGEPDEVTGEMVVPHWLGPDAREKWFELIPIMQGRGTYSPAYVDSLALYCQAFEDMRHADDAIRDNGSEYLVSEKTGALYLHPAVGIKFNAIDRMAKFGREFGFSPASVRDVQVNKTPTTSDKKRFFA